MTRLRLVALIALVALVALTGCGSDEPGAAPPAPSRTAPAGSASPGGAGSSSPTSSPSASTPVEFTVDGAGPYQLGATLDALRSTLDEIKSGGPACVQNTTARGTGTWRDVHLSFRPDGLLYLATNRSPSVPTPSGAWLGTPLAQLKKIYANVTGQELAKGTHRAYLVTTLSGRGILFDLDVKTAVTAMYAADASYLRNAFAGGAFC
jgi:predicted small lipoprotein YifL